MKTAFTKNYSKNYILLEDFQNYDYKNDFRIQMLSNNSIANTLDFSYTVVDNQPVFKYDITSKQSFSSLFLTNSITYRAYTNILLSLMDTLCLLEEYLININSLLIDENYIYLDPEKYTPYFIVCPALNSDFYTQLSLFFENILKKIDHSDDRLVLLAYRISSEASKDGFNISMLKSIILSSGIEATSSNIPISTLPDRLNSKNSSSIINHELASVNSADNFNELNKNSTFMHNEHSKSEHLYTISTYFYIKSILLGGIFIILLTFSLYCLYTKLISKKLSLILLGLSFLQITGSFKYLYSIFPSSKIPVSEKALPEYTNPTDNNFKASSENTISKDILPSHFSQVEFGDTILLSKQSFKSDAHRLIYTGTDYSDNIPINSYPFTIGKLKNSADMVINNPFISRIHACIYCDNNDLLIEDMNSANGTYVNDVLLSPHEKFKLSEGDKITFSHLTYIFE